MVQFFEFFHSPPSGWPFFFAGSAKCTRNPDAGSRLDFAGAFTTAAGLGGLTYGFTAWPELDATSPSVLAALTVGAAGLLGFVLAERRSRNPMLPLEVFRSRAFTAANLVTFAVYAALGGVFFLFVLNLQVVAGFEPLTAGTALLCPSPC